MIRGVAKGEFGVLGALEIQVHVVLPREADAAVHLDALAGGVAIGVAAIRLGHGYGQGRLGHVFIHGPGRIVGGGFGRLHLQHHLGALVLDGLKAADRAPELDALLGVRHADVEHLLRPADHLGAQRRGANVQHFRQYRPAHVHGADQTVAPDDNVVEHHLALFAGLVHGLEQGDGNAGGVAVHQEQADAETLVAGRLGARRYHHYVRDVGVGHEQFGAGDGKTAVGRSGIHVHNAPRLETARGFRHRQGGDHGAVGDFRQIGFLLLLRAAEQDGLTRQEHRREERRRQQRSAHFFQNDGEIDKPQALAAVFFGKCQPEPSEGGHLLPQVGRVTALIFHHLPHEGAGAVLGQEIVRRLPQHVLLIAETKIHRSNLLNGDVAAPIRA